MKGSLENKHGSLMPCGAVLRECGVSRSTVGRMLLAGTFPAPVRLKASRRGRRMWHRADVERWIAEQKP